MKTVPRDETPEGRPSPILSAVATLAAAASREINNPLMVIVGNLELLERSQTLDADGRARLGVVLATAGQLREKVRRLERITGLQLAVGAPDLPPMLDLDKSTSDGTEALRNAG